MSEYVRLRDSNAKGYCTCTTCGEVRFWKGEYMNAGHFFPVKLNPKLRFDPLNIHVQCNVCNGTLEGQQYFMSLYIKKHYGQDTIDYLVQNFRQPFEFTEEWLDKEISIYSEKVQELKKIKNLT